MKKAVSLAVLLAGVLFLTVGCEKAKLTQPTDEEGQNQTGAAVGESTTGSVNVANIVIHTAGGKALNIPVEIAATDAEREKGLKGRTELPFKTGGMWFVFPEDVKDPFWTEGTAMSLDMIFVGPDMKVVDIKANTAPNSEDKIYPMKDDQVILYRYVLEVGAGFAATNGVAAGDAMVLGMGLQ